MSETFWNGEPTLARRVSIVCADATEFPAYWGRSAGIIGTRRNAVEVTYNGETFYLDDEADPGEPESRPGSGWGKVTLGHGSPRYGHRELRPVVGTVKAREHTEETE